MENEAKCLQGFVTLALNTYYIAFIQNMTVIISNSVTRTLCPTTTYRTRAYPKKYETSLQKSTVLRHIYVHILWFCGLPKVICLCDLKMEAIMSVSNPLQCLKWSDVHKTWPGFQAASKLDTERGR